MIQHIAIRSVLMCAVALLVAGSPAVAQPSPCFAARMPTGELAAWPRQVPMMAAGTPSQLPAAILPIGRAVEARLLESPRVRYYVRPDRPPSPVSYGGMIAIMVHQAGIYRVALGSAGWIDMIGANRLPVPSIAHGHGPDCTSIRKTVDFQLIAGRYTVQISDSDTMRAGVMVARIP